MRLTRASVLQRWATGAEGLLFRLIYLSSFCLRRVPMCAAATRTPGRLHVDKTSPTGSPVWTKATHRTLLVTVLWCSWYNIILFNQCIMWFTFNLNFIFSFVFFLEWREAKNFISPIHWVLSAVWSQHLKKVVVKSEYTEKGNENDWGLEWPLYVETLKRLLSLEDRRPRRYVQISQNHEGGG